MVIWTLLSIFGFGIAVRTLRSFKNLQLFEEKQYLILNLICSVGLFFLLYLFRSQPLLVWLIIVVIFLSPFMLNRLMSRFLEGKVKKKLLSVLDYLIISMRSGISLRQSIKNCASDNSGYLRVLLSEFVLSIELRKNRINIAQNQQIHIFFNEIELIDQVAMRQIERLKSLKHRIYTEEKFRQKSRKATMQARAQAWIISIIFLLLVLFVSYEFGFYKNFKLIFWSSLIFTIGLFFVCNIGRNYQWKL